ncbi:hypothetical protein BDV35DRAFT_386628 [Aspergillus flavus]|uniref:Rhodopsin domain-containing protein n=1 Tax=Aspergillus flavus TaxID=5059 RepID=A0A5N6HGV5_ASPFL|nr:hypothetical protein BDV35DRAFT_386628 [Aspergillus flavus]KAJ1717712.1 hypothetical protein NYO67_34 [Aspergillus flavus]
MSRILRQSLTTSVYMVLASLVFYYSYGAVTYVTLVIGKIGHPLEEIELWRLAFTIKCFYYHQIAYAIGIGLVKCIIVVVLRRIFGVSSPAFRIATWINLALCASWSLMTILIGLLNCRPLNYHWVFKSPAGHCVNPNATYTAVGMLDKITDVLIILTPVPMVLRLRITPLQKLGILGIFALGVVYVFPSIPGLLCKMVFIWTTIEWAVAIIVASAPMLRSLIEHIIHHKIFQSFT